MDSFLSDAFFKYFSSTVNMFISLFMIQIFQQLNFSNIGRNFLLGNRKNSQIFNEDFYLPLYSPLCIKVYANGNQSSGNTLIHLKVWKKAKKLNDLLIFGAFSSLLAAPPVDTRWHVI